MADAGGRQGQLQARTLFVQEGAPPLQAPWLHAERRVVITEAVMRKLTGEGRVGGLGGCLGIWEYAKGRICRLQLPQTTGPHGGAYG